MRPINLVLVAICALMLGACGGSEVASIEGEYFADDPTNRQPFHVQGEQAERLAELVTDLEPTEHLKWQGAAVFTITYKNGTKQEVQVPKANAVLINNEAYKADQQAIVAIIQDSLD